jgi:hypothetical protein
MFCGGEDPELALPSELSSSNGFDQKILFWKEPLVTGHGVLWILEDLSFLALHLAYVLTITAPASVPFEEEHVLLVNLWYFLLEYLVISRTSAEVAECQKLTNYQAIKRSLG